MGRRKTAEEAAWLAERYPTTPNAELADEFEREFGWRVEPVNIACWAHDRGLRKDSGNVEWSSHPEYDEFLRGYIPGHREREIADAFEREFGIRLTRAQVKNAKTRVGVASGTHGGRFEPGQEAWNRGRPQAEWMPPESVERTCATRFQTGQLPHNARDLPVGSERVSVDGYVEVKVAERPSGEGPAHDNWRPKAHLVWEGANGRALRPGEVVVFADGDRSNLDPGNLVAMTRAEHNVIVRRGITYADRETCETAVRIARVKMAASRASMRPRRCRRCGREFSPRYGRQRTCDACLGREGK